jgi:hypothetical protein
MKIKGASGKSKIKIRWKRVWVKFERWFSSEADTVPTWKQQKVKIAELVESDID